MIHVIKLSNRIGFAINFFGLKIPFILGVKERYYDPPLQVGVKSELKVRKHWFVRDERACGLSSACSSAYMYKAWRGYGYSVWESIRVAARSAFR